ncbi:MAG: hypothetical protein ACREIC_09260, partial [Limisphaerales bacterium]
MNCKESLISALLCAPSRPRVNPSAVCAATLLMLSLDPISAQPTNDSPYPIDLPAALRLAGARNLDIQLARERLSESQANRQSAVEQFFPWIT